MRRAPAIAGYRIRIPRTVYLSHPSSLEHDTGPHPERAERIVAIERLLAERDWLGAERRRSPAAARAAIEAVHASGHIERIERLCADGGGALDLDTVVSPGSFRAALHGAGGAIELVDLLLGERADNGFSAHRPPGHHAQSARAMGFCLFNNVAIAARHALEAHGLERVLVLDWDVHHGNGTHDIFHASPEVLYVSIHQSQLYPGTGAGSDVGAGEGRGCTLNLPVPPGSGDETFVSLVEHVVVPLARGYRPQLILLSAGYDAHADDPLAECRVSDVGFGDMTAWMRLVAEQLGVRVGAVLEGGYDLGALSRGTLATLEMMRAENAPEPAARPLHPLAAGVLARLEP